MSHLNDEQLVHILYAEVETSLTDETTSHLETCQDCRDRLQLLRNTCALLDRATLPDRPIELDADQIIAATHETPLTTRTPPWQLASGWMQKALAASLLVAIAAAGFAAGNYYRSAQLTSELEALESRLTQRLTHQTPVTVDTSRDTGLERVERALRRMANEQNQLRRELQSLAVNAESEIQRTNQQVKAARAALIQLQQLAGITW
ncbi:MAG: hypothetical protein ACR2NP_02595 [Pirellulaceae bacterium]